MKDVQGSTCNSSHSSKNIRLLFIKKLNCQHLGELHLCFRFGWTESGDDVDWIVLEEQAAGF